MESKTDLGRKPIHCCQNLVERKEGGKVLEGGGEEEGECQEELDGGADDELEDSPRDTQENHVEGEEARREEQQA